MAFKVFQNGTALTAEDLNDVIVEQAVITFADAASRDNAIPTPNEGQHCFLVTTGLTYTFKGGKWVPVMYGEGPGGLKQEPVITCTSTTRPTPVVGRLIYETDTNRMWQGADAGGGTTVWKFFRFNSITNPPSLVTARIGQSIPFNVQTEVSAWDKATANKYYIDNDFFTWTGSGQQYPTVKQSGLYSVTVQVDSDAGFAGSSKVLLATQMHLTKGWWNSNIIDNRQRATGYSGAGSITQNLHWTGYLAANAPCGVDIYQWNTNSGAVTYNIYYAMTCIG